MSQEPTTAERKPTTQPLTPPEPLAPSDDRRVRYPDKGRARRGPWGWGILALVLALAAGGVALFARPADPLSDPRPLEVVQGFVAAIEARDVSKMLSYVEPTVFRREISPEIRSYVEYLQEVRFENARYTLLDNDGERAHVRWTATMRYTLNLGSQTKAGERAVDMTFELSKFEGSWYLHSAALPKT